MRLKSPPKSDEPTQGYTHTGIELSPLVRTTHMCLMENVRCGRWNVSQLKAAHHSCVCVWVCELVIYLWVYIYIYGRNLSSGVSKRIDWLSVVLCVVWVELSWSIGFWPTRVALMCCVKTVGGRWTRYSHLLIKAQFGYSGQAKMCARRIYDRLGNGCCAAGIEVVGIIGKYVDNYIGIICRILFFFIFVP